MNSPSKLQSLLRMSDWSNAICNCEDPSVKREALLHCATVMLPYWEARFDRDDSMAKVVMMMADVVASPTPENLAALRASIPKRERQFRDLSPPPGFFDQSHSDCPADFAGDSIFYAACALGNDVTDDCDDQSAFDNAIEAMARLFVERDPNYDDVTDYPGMAADYLREKLLQKVKIRVGTAHQQ